MFFPSLLVVVDVVMAVGKKGFSKEDELLLQDFSKNVSTKVTTLKSPDSSKFRKESVLFCTSVYSVQSFDLLKIIAFVEP